MAIIKEFSLVSFNLLYFNKLRRTFKFTVLKLQNCRELWSRAHPMYYYENNIMWRPWIIFSSRKLYKPNQIYLFSFLDTVLQVRTKYIFRPFKTLLFCVATIKYSSVFWRLSYLEITTVSRQYTNIQVTYSDVPNNLLIDLKFLSRLSLGFKLQPNFE